NVIESHVTPTVFSNEPRAIHRENHRQMLNGHIVNEVVVRALEKRRVDRAHRPDSAGGQASGEGYRVSLRDSDVEETVGIHLGKRAGSRSTRHCASDRDNAWVLFRQLDQTLAECRGVRGVRSRYLALLSSRGIVPRRKCVPLFNMLASRESFSFLCDAVNQPRPV